MFLSAWQLDRRPDACKRSTNGGVTALTVINIGGSCTASTLLWIGATLGLYVDRATSKERRQRQHRGKPSPFAVGVVAAQPRGPPSRHRCKSLPENMPIIDRNFERFRSGRAPRSQTGPWVPARRATCLHRDDRVMPQSGMSILCACSSQRVGDMQIASQWSFPRSALA